MDLGGRVVVLGAGAIGGLIGGRLFESGHDVTLVARGAHYETMARDGLTLASPTGEVTLAVPVARGPEELELHAGDTVIVAVKSQHTVGLLERLGPVAPAGVAVVCAQNGVHNEEEALRRFADVYGMCVMCPATHLEPGVVVASSSPVTGLLDVGRYPDGVDERAEALAAALEASTFRSVARPDIMEWKRQKLLMNLANPIEALCGMDSDAARTLFRRARAEGEEAFAAAGLAYKDRQADRERRGELLNLQPVAGRERGGGSTWQSLRRGAGSVETDWLNGEIALLGRRHSVPTPVNALLQRLAGDAVVRGAGAGSMSADTILAMLPDDGAG